VLTIVVISAQQQAQAQLIQTPDGQTFIYQPVQVDNSQTIAQQQQTQPTCKFEFKNFLVCAVLSYIVCIILVISINGNIMQLSSPPANNSPTVTQTATTVSQGVPQNQQNIVMVRYIIIIISAIFERRGCQDV
jgi:hypothetical protein